MTPIIKLIGYAIAAGFLIILGFWLIWLTEAFLEEKAPPVLTADAMRGQDFDKLGSNDDCFPMENDYALPESASRKNPLGRIYET
mgnify:CR=1 FL=1